MLKFENRYTLLGVKRFTLKCTSKFQRIKKIIAMYPTLKHENKVRSCFGNTMAPPLSDSTLAYKTFIGFSTLVSFQDYLYRIPKHGDVLLQLDST